MPLTPPFDSKWEVGDLFYGLAKDRDALMKHLGVSFEYGVGAKINFFDVGDVKEPTQQRPQDNAFFAEWLGQHKKYSRSAGSAVYNKPLADCWRHWREKSKGGIEWQTKVRKKNVHFCLDRMTDPLIQHAITTKTFGDQDSDPTVKVAWDKKNRAITNAELRWIYRNRKDPDVNARVQCWENLKPCPPPWGRGDAILDGLWNAYKPL